MTKLKKFVLFFVAASSSAAVIADDWQGLYVGAKVGYGKGQSSVKYTEDSYYTLAGGDFGNTFVYENVGVALHAGYNKRLESYVFGVEGGYQPGRFEEKDTGVYSSLFPEDKFKTSVGEIFTLVGRLGKVTGDWLGFIKAGYANAAVKYHADSGAPGAGVLTRDSGRVDGWVAGAGLEYKVTDHVSLGLEYSHYDFNNKHFSKPTLGVPSADPNRLDVNPMLDTLLFGASYHFN